MTDPALRARMEGEELLDAIAEALLGMQQINFHGMQRWSDECRSALESASASLVTLTAQLEALRAERDTATEQMRRHWVENGKLEAKVKALEHEVAHLKKRNTTDPLGPRRFTVPD